MHTYPSWFVLEGWLEVERQDSDLRGCRGVFCVGVVFTYMAFNNFRATIGTLMEKRRGNAKREGRLVRQSSSTGRTTPAATPRKKA